MKMRGFKLSFIRYIGRVYLLSIGSFYDLYRTLRYGGWIDRNTLEYKEFMLRKSYHSLEKSITARQFQQGRGISAIESTFAALERFDQESAANSKVYKEAIYSVKNFLSFVNDLDLVKNYENRLLKLFGESQSCNGSENSKPILSFKGWNEFSSAEMFFSSRQSIRSYENKQVNKSEIEKIAKYAGYGPSACNRNSARLICIVNKILINKVLAIQGGAKTFVEDVNTLICVISDQEAFVSGNERYQHWIDGGMFAMSFVYAAHALGYGTCCLNWSKMILDDLNVRKLIDIKKSERIIMFVSIGHPDTTQLSCMSKKKPIQDLVEFYE